jgi:signal transduction histidine kinase
MSLHLMKRAIERYSLPALLAGMLLLLILSTYNRLLDIGRPFPGFYIIRLPDGKSWAVWLSTPAWWPGLQGTGLTHADDIIAINGVRLAPGVDYFALFQQAHARGESHVVLTVQRNGQLITAQAPLVRFTPQMWFDLYFHVTLLGICAWLMALTVYLAQPQARLNRATAIVGLLACGVIGVHASSLNFDDSSLVSRLLDLSWVLTTSCLGAWIFEAIMHLTVPANLLIGHRLYQVGRRLIWLLCALGGASYLASKALWWTGGWSSLVSWLDQAGFYLAEVTIFGTGAFAMLWTVRTVWRAQSRRLRRQSQILLVGFLLAAPMIVTLFYSDHTASGSFFTAVMNLHYLYLAIPAALSYAILRYQMFRTGRSLFLLSFALAGTGLMVGLGSGLVRIAGWPVEVVIFLLVMGAGAVSVLLPRLLSRLFNWEGQRYSAVQRFVERFSRQSNLTLLPAEITEALVDELQLERAALWLLDSDGRLALAHVRALHAVALPDVLAPPADAWAELRAPIWLESRTRPPAWLGALREAGLVVAAPLAMHGQPLGLLGLGMRWDEEVFQPRDLEVIALVAYQISLALLNAQQIAALRQVPHLISQVQERERSRLAQELHDTTQQFLGRLPFHIEFSRTAMLNGELDKASAQLLRCVSDIEDNARTLRQIRHNLSPIQLQGSLIRSLQALIDHFRARTGLCVQVELAEEVDAALSVEARHALYRVAQQALDNIEAHAQAQNVRVALMRTPDDAVCLCIEDDGRGFLVTEAEQWAINGRFGLRSMRARLESVGGHLTVDSAPGRGTRVMARLSNSWQVAQRSPGLAHLDAA